jgi:hypothetical protein
MFVILLLRLYDSLRCPIQLVSTAAEAMFIGRPSAGPPPVRRERHKVYRVSPNLNGSCSKFYVPNVSLLTLTAWLLPFPIVSLRT